jgi:hypothetical protein
MSDEELIARLRKPCMFEETHDYDKDDAADRIEQLVNENTWLKTNVEEFHHGEKLWAKKLNAAKAKLAKALDALQLASAELLVIGVMGLHQTALTAANKAREVLAELEKTE